MSAIQHIFVCFILFVTNIMAYENQQYTNNIIIKLSKETNLKSYLNEFNLEHEKKLDTNLYLLKVKNKALLLEITNKLEEKKDVLYVQPDYIRQMVPR